MPPFAENSSTYARLRGIGVLVIVLALLGAVPDRRQPLASETSHAAPSHAPTAHDGSEEGHSAEAPSLLDNLMPERSQAGHDEMTDSMHESGHSPAQPGDHSAPGFGSAIEVHHPSAGTPAVSVRGDPAMGAQLQHPILPAMFGQSAMDASAEGRPDDLSAIYATLANADAKAGATEESIPEMHEADEETSTSEVFVEPLPPDPRAAVNEADESVLIEKLEIDARRARYIVEFRRLFGPFAKPEDLAQVVGITDSMALEWEKADLIKFD